MQTQSPRFRVPHVVVLGAGASRAALPDGAKHGMQVPLMDDLIDGLDLLPVLTGFGIEPIDGDFESLYSRLAENGRHKSLLVELERSVYDYFSRLSLPEKPTLYDHLVLSLREKDVIVTFNWDPFLWQARVRNERFAPMPACVFLHGNVAVGYCTKHEPVVIGHRKSRCRRCCDHLEPSRLLYPVRQKNYTDDPMIKKSWEWAQKSLNDAFILTIFGYGAPATDVEACELLKVAWANSRLRNKAQVEIVNIASPEELEGAWKPFFCRGHYSIYCDFYRSLAAHHPRRSCEDFWEASMQGQPQPDRNIPLDADWQQLRAWFEPLLEQERKTVS